jgi:hypothetical protein
VFQLRDYQTANAQLSYQLLSSLGLAYLAMSVRTGKTLTALEAARLYGATHVLFLTKKSAMGSIRGDYEKLQPGYKLTVINDQSLHKVDLKGVDLLVYDESHRLGAQPKPCQMAKLLRQKFGHLPIILLSGTPTPETWSQIFHQFWISHRSPFPERNFYRWADTYVDKYQRMLPHGTIDFYDRAKEDLIEQVIKPYMIRFTQEQAGFICQINEEICPVEMPMGLKRVADTIMDCGVAYGQPGLLTADGPAAQLQKVHQLHSGTIIYDPGDDGKRLSLVLSDAKARYIAQRWPTEKLVIFYVYKHELAAIKQALGDRVTTDLEEFQTTDKSCAFQIVSGREGLNLSLGELIVFYNISHSATSYWQGRDRLTTLDRPVSNIYWLFSQFEGKWGIEHSIYNVVLSKKRYTTDHFKREYLCSNRSYKPGSSSNTRKRDTILSRSSEQIRAESLTCS